MENCEENFENVRKELRKANAEVRLSNCFDDVITDNERLKTDLKLLQGQYEYNTTKLSEAETKCEGFEREVEQLKRKNGKQELKIDSLQREIDASIANKEKIKKIRAKFALLKSQEKVHDIAVGSLKSQLEEQMEDLLNEDALQKDLLSDQSINVAVPASISDNKNVEVFIDLQDDHSPSTSTAVNYEEGINMEGVNMEESKVVEPQLTDSSADRNSESISQARTLVFNYKQKSVQSTTVTNRSTSTSMKMTRMKCVKKLVRNECSIDAATRSPKGLNSKTLAKHQDQSKAIIPSRLRRILKCNFCWLGYTSSPTRAFCVCRY